MSQFDIFSNPGTRNTDPGTSHKAEHQFTVLGKRAVRCRQVLKLIYDHPGSTTGELARFMVAEYPGLPIACAVESPHKRVADLEEKCLVARGNPRTCLDTGRERIVWHITHLGVRELNG